MEVLHRYGAFLYRLNYEEYKKNELEMDKKIKKLSVEGEDEEIEPLDEAYIIRVDDEEDYVRYKELKKKEFKTMTLEEKEETIELQSRFIAQEPDDECVFEDMVYEENTEYGEMLKQVF